MLSLTEGLYSSLLTNIETMSARVSGSRSTSESCPTREKTCSTLTSDVRWHTVCLKTTKCKGNRIRICHIISNSFCTPSSELTKHWHSSCEILDHLRIVTERHSTGICVRGREVGEGRERESHSQETVDDLSHTQVSGREVGEGRERERHSQETVDDLSHTHSPNFCVLQVLTHTVKTLMIRPD
jgi:hypothetical protein